MDQGWAQLISLPKVYDPRGNLSFIESLRHVPFEVKRAYWIYDVPGGMYRNGHAFRRQDELIVALSGSFDVVLNDGSGPVRHHMARSYYALYVPRMTWRTIDNFSTNSVVLVLSSTEYDADDYIEDFTRFRAEKAALKQQDSAPQALEPPVSHSENAGGLNASPSARHTTDDCLVVSLERHHHANGNLTAVGNGSLPLPFELKRVFYLYDIPGGEARGGHAHRELVQCIVAISGAFDVMLDDGQKRRKVTLNRPYQALLVPPGIWNVLDNFSSGAVCMVLASQHYKEDDYIRDYDTFINEYGCDNTEN